MRDIDFLSKLLCLERPWAVERVDFVDDDQSMHVILRHRSNGRFHCPECGLALPLYDHTPLRSWRHVDHGSRLTWLVARIPRVACLFHGIRRVQIPWALQESRFTLAFEKHAIDTLLEADVLGATRLLRISWDEAWGLMERAVERGKKAKKRRVIPYLGVDEKAVAKRHKYVTLVSDLDRGTVEFIADNHEKTSLDAYYASLTTRQLEGIQAVAMDMWDPFIRSTLEHVPDAGRKIVFDRFHIMKHMNEAVDAVRKEEHRRLTEEGDDTLIRTKYLWLFAEENLPESFVERFARLKSMDLKTARAWAIKENLRILWAYSRRDFAMRFWKHWYFWATHSRLKPVVKVARMLKNHLPNVLSYCDHRITNATSEGLNSKIQTVKKTPTVSAIVSTSRSPSTFTAEAWSCTPSKPRLFRRIRTAEVLRKPIFYPL
jgi:transposase